MCLVDWLQSGQATWKGLVEAVFRPSGGGHQVLARDIAKGYKSKCVLNVVLPASRIFPSGVRMRVNTFCVGGEGKIRLVTVARFSCWLPKIW